jgi:hypothetical protein
LKKTAALCILLVLISTISFSILTNAVSAEGPQPDPEDPYDPGAYLIVHVEPAVPGIEVTLNAVDEGWVKTEDGSWFHNWHKSATAITDSQGNAKFRMFRLYGFKMDVNIAACGKVIGRTYLLELLLCAPTYTETMTCGPIHAVPEVPFLGSLGLSLIMIISLGLFLVKPRKLEKT